MYHPQIGRFLQMDPSGFDAGDMNLFRYCADDPVDRSDSTGLYGEEIPNLEEAIHVARSQVLKGVRDPNRQTKPYHFKEGGAGRTITYTPGISVPVLRAESGKYEIGKMVYGTVQKIGKDYFDVEPVRERGTVIPVHSHNDNRPEGLGTPGWSSLDRELKMVERMDESNPGWWYRGVRDKNGHFIPGKPQYDNGAARTSGSYNWMTFQRSGSNSGSQSSGPTAAEVDAAHQATGVPSLGAEAVNYVNGRL